MANLENETDFEDVVETAEAVEETFEESVEETTEEEVSEDTVAAQSLKTHGVQGKADAMSHLMGYMNGMSKGDAVDFFHKVMGQFGPGKDYGVGDKSGANQSTVDMKPSHAVASSTPKTAYPMPRLDSKNHWAEDVEDMFNGEELSEEFKEKTSVIFEAAVNARVSTEVARLEEAYEVALEEQVNEITQEISAKLDNYLDYVVENWMKENEVAIESTLRNEVMDDFIGGLKNLFAEHYVSIPEDKVDVLESLATKVASLEEKLDEAINENAELKGVLSEEAKKDIFEELASDLALTQQEKFSALAEGIEFDGDLETYTRKLEIIKENYFADNSVHTSNIIEESFEGETGERVGNVDPQVNRYVQALARTVKK
jgi:hypothetical protein